MSKKLTKNEIEVLKLSYLPRKEVAIVRGVKESTINSQRTHILNKLMANTLCEAVLIALKKGIVKLEDFQL